MKIARLWDEYYHFVSGVINKNRLLPSFRDGGEAIDLAGPVYDWWRRNYGVQLQGKNWGLAHGEHNTTYNSWELLFQLSNIL